MSEAIAVYVSVVAIVVLVGALFIPRSGHTRLQSGDGATPIGEGQRGGIVDRIAGWVVMGLGHLTITVLHIFERLGVDMTAFDEALARLTDFTSRQATSLREASDTIAEQAAEIRRLIDEDAAQDEIDRATARAEALEEAADKIDAVVDNLENPQVDPPVDPEPETPVEPGPPETPPSSDVPVTDTPAPVVEDPAPVEEPVQDLDAQDRTGQ